MSECKDCGKEEVKHICPKCGKEYKTKRWLDQHIQGCVEVEEVIELNVAETIIKEAQEVDTQDIMTQTKNEIRSWMDGLGGRMSANRMELERMFGWFKILHPKSTMRFDYTCPSCVQHCFRKLKEIVY